MRKAISACWVPIVSDLSAAGSWASPQEGTEASVPFFGVLGTVRPRDGATRMGSRSEPSNQCQCRRCSSHHCLGSRHVTNPSHQRIFLDNPQQKRAVPVWIGPQVQEVLRASRPVAI